MNDLEIGIDFNFNTAEAQTETDRIKNNISKIGSTAEEVNKKVAQSLKSISILDKSTLDQLQKFKDAKQATYDAAAASIGGKSAKIEVPPVNNIKEVAGEILNLKKVSEENNKEQEKGTGVISELLGGMFSWGGALTLVGGLVWNYREKIMAWVTEMWTGVEVNTALIAAQEAVNKSMQDASTLIAKEIAETNIAIDKINDKNTSLEKREDLLNQFINNNPAVLGALNLQNIATAQGTTLIDNYVSALKKKIQLQQLEKGYSESLQKTADIESGKEDTEIGWLGKSMLVAKNFFTFSGDKQTEKDIQASNKRLKQKALDDEAVTRKGYEDKIKAMVAGDKAVKDVEDNSVKSAEARLANINERLRNLQKGESAKNLKEQKAALEKEIKERNIALGLEQPDKPKKVAKAGVDTTIKEREGLYEKMMALDAKYSRKSFTKDEEEVAALKNKFKEIRTLIEEFNKKNPKKAISLVGLNELEVTAEGDLKYRQQTSALKTSLEDQKKLYSEYENYKTTFGEAKAKERFTNEVKSNKDLIKELSVKQAAIVAASFGGKLNAPQKERFNQNKKDITALTDLELKRYADAYKEAETFNQKIDRINEKYTERAKLIREQAAKEGVNPDAQIAVLNDKWQAELNGEKEAALKKIEIYKNLNEEIITLTREQIKVQLKSIASILDNPSVSEKIKSDLKKLAGNLNEQLNLNPKKLAVSGLEKEKGLVLGKISEREQLDITSPEDEAELKKLKAKLIEIEGEINKINAKGLKGFVAGLKDNKTLKGVTDGLGLASDAAMTMSTALGGLDTKAGYTLDTIGQLAGAAADIGGAILSGNPVQMVGAAIKAVGTLFSIGKKVKEMNAKARQEVADFYANAISGEREYQDLLAQRGLQNIRDNKIVLQGIRDEVALRKTQLSAYAKETAEVMAKLQGQSSIASETYKHGTWFRKAEVKKTYASLGGKSFAELSQLLAQGKLEGDAKALVERLKELEQNGYDAQQAMADLARETSALFTGTSADNLTNSLLEMFRSGKTGAQDLADFFKETMNDAALSIFKNKVLSDLMIKFYDEFDKSAQSDDNLTDKEIVDLKALFLTLTDEVKAKFENLKKITGSDLTSPTGGSTSSSATGGIRGTLTEETGNKIEGISRAQYEILKQNLAVNKEHSILLRENTISINNGLDLIRSQHLEQLVVIANNTGETVSELKKAIKAIDKVVDNTRPSLTPKQMGI